MAVIGTGSYGCVYSPSLPCSEPGRNDSNQVSKLMLEKDAAVELAEYETISKLDPKSAFSLKPPVMCAPAEAGLYDRINECPIKKRFVDAQGALKPLALLVMEHGGSDLFDLIQWFHDPGVLSSLKKETADRFWRQIPVLFDALKTLQTAKMMHHDIKLENIVFDKATARIAFIDFGELTSFDSAMKQVVPKRRPNIPVESILYDPSTFEYDKTHRYTAHAYHSDFLPHVLTGNVAGPGLTRQQDYANIQNELDEFSKSSVSYDSFKKKSVETTDLYGLGQALLIMRNNTRAYQGKVNVEGIEAVLRRCITPHVMRRFSVDEANRAIQKAFHPPTPPPLVKLFRSKSEPLRATKKVYIQQGVRSQTSPQKSKARFSLQKTRVSKARSSPQKTRSSPIKARTSPRKTRASPIKARTSPIKARASPQINF